MTAHTSSTDSVGSDRTDSLPPRALAAAVAVGLVVAALGVGAVFAAGLVATLGLWYPITVGSAALVLGGLLGLQAGYGAVGLAFARRYLGVLPVATPDRDELNAVAAGVVAASALALGLTAALAAAGLGDALSVAGVAADVSPDLLLAFALLALGLVVPAEELLFRGAVQTRLRRAFGPAGAIVGASLLSGATYALTYAVYADAAAAAAAGAFVATGIVYGALFERTNNLVVPLLAHGAVETAVFAAAYATALGAFGL